MLSASCAFPSLTKLSMRRLNSQDKGYNVGVGRFEILGSPKSEIVKRKIRKVFEFNDVLV